MIREVILSLALSALIWNQAAAALPAVPESTTYEITVERTGEVEGLLMLLADGAVVLEMPCWEHPSERLPAGVYHDCAATKLATSKKPGVFVPAKDRTGVFIRAGKKDAVSGGSILVADEAMSKIHGAIKPKNEKNVTLRVRSPRLAKSAQALREVVAAAKKQLEAARDAEERKELEMGIVFAINLGYLQDLAHDSGVGERLIAESPLYDFLHKKGTNAAKKAITKKAIVELLKRIGKAGLKRAAGIAVDLFWPSELGRDWDEVFRDKEASDSEFASAASSLLHTKRRAENSGAFEQSYRLLLEHLGYDLSPGEEPK